MKEAQRWIVGSLLCAIACGRALGQAPAASAPAASEEYKGLTLSTAFSGSVAPGSDVYEWTTTSGYTFNKHFSVNLGLPILFVHGTTSTGTTTSTSGLGNVFGQLQFVDKNPVVNFGAVATLALPTGSSSKGLSTGRVTGDLTGQVAKRISRFTPFLSAGVANSRLDSLYWRLPYITLGALAHFEGGTSFDLAPPLTVSASLYDVAPWGTQKVYSRVVTRNEGGGGTSKQGRVYMDNALTTSDSSIDRDNGFNADIDFHPWRYVSVHVAYIHSVHFQTDTFSFGVGFNLTPLLRRSGISGR